MAIAISFYNVCFRLSPHKYYVDESPSASALASFLESGTMVKKTSARSSSAHARFGERFQALAFPLDRRSPEIKRRVG